MPAFAVGLSVIASAWFLLGYCWRGPSLGKSVIKTIAVAGLALAAFWLEAPLLLIAALSLGAAGDYLLSHAGERAFFAGLGAFALSHLAYAALFVSHGAALKFDTATLGIGLFALVVGYVLFRHAGALRWPVAVYVCIIAVMGMLAVDLRLLFIWGGIAAALFIISDAVLGLELFVLPQHGRLSQITPFVVWAFYWVAQFLFLVSFAGPVFV